MVGESKSPLLVATPTREELAAAEAEAWSLALALAAANPRISDKIDVGLETSCCRSSS